VHSISGLTTELPKDKDYMTANRFWIAVAAVVLQIALGAVSAWSVFSVPLSKQFEWSISEVTLTFTICIFVLGFASFFGGLWLSRRGPRIVAATGGLLYGTGLFLASFSNHGLWWLYTSHGVIVGIGLGFCNIASITVLAKWFPDRRGLMTGIAVGGFGAGGVITAPVATHLIRTVGVLRTFAYLGIAFLIVTVGCGFFMRNPPEGWKPAGWTPTVSEVSNRFARDYSFVEALKTRQWWALWLLLFLNTSAGISMISLESPLFQESLGVTAAVAAGMVGITSIGNALGRVFWAWTSDFITRRGAFLAMLLAQVLLFWIFPSVHSVWLLTTVAFLVLVCFGGGFGTMPAFAADYFGSKNVGPIYGLMLTAWGFAGAFGPLLIVHMRQASGNYRGALHAIAAMVTFSMLVPIVVHPPSRTKLSEQLAPGQRNGRSVASFK
jgi:MFS transporter, OFA family, oxalate/formate antiporter